MTSEVVPYLSPYVDETGPFGPLGELSLETFVDIFGDDQRLVGISQSEGELLAGRVTEHFLAGIPVEHLPAAEIQARIFERHIAGHPRRDVADDLTGGSLMQVREAIETIIAVVSEMDEQHEGDLLGEYIREIFEADEKVEPAAVDSKYVLEAKRPGSEILIDGDVQLSMGRVAVSEAARQMRIGLSSKAVLAVISEVVVHDEIAPLTRGDLEHLTGYTQGHISRIVKLLSMVGAVTEGGLRVTSLNRPVLTVRPSAYLSELSNTIPGWAEAVRPPEAEQQAK